MRIQKNQIVITTLAVLIAIAGYLTYDSATTGAVATSKDLAKTTETTSESEEVMNPGESILTGVLLDNSNYAASVKLNREQVRAKNKEVLQAIIDNDSLDSKEKQNAVQAMIHITEIAQMEADAEMMLEAKGFTNVVVSIGEKECDVVLDMGEVTDAKRAQVEDIVKRKTNVEPQNIVITPINVNETD